MYSLEYYSILVTINIELYYYQLGYNHLFLNESFRIFPHFTESHQPLDTGGHGCVYLVPEPYVAC